MSEHLLLELRAPGRIEIAVLVVDEAVELGRGGTRCRKAIDHVRRRSDWRRRDRCRCGHWHIRQRRRVVGSGRGRRCLLRREAGAAGAVVLALLLAGLHPAFPDRRQALAAARMRRAVRTFGHERGHRLLRVVQGGAHLVEHEAGEFVGLQFGRRLAAAGRDGVAGQVMPDLVRHDADRRPGVAARGRAHDVQEVAVERDHALRNLLRIEHDHRCRVRHRRFHHLEVLRQAGELHDLRHHVAAIGRQARAKLITDDTDRRAVVGTGLKVGGDLVRERGFTFVGSNGRRLRGRVSRRMRGDALARGIGGAATAGAQANHQGQRQRVARRGDETKVHAGVLRVGAGMEWKDSSPRRED